MNKVISIVWGQRFSLALGLSLLAVSGIGHATVISGSSSSYGVNANAALDQVFPLPDVQLNVGPVPVSGGSAPPPYNDPQQVLNLQAGVAGALSLSASVLDTNAVSNIDGGNGPRFAFADASVDDLSFNALGALGLTLGAEQVSSTASAAGDYGALGGSGGASLTNAFISLGGISIALDALPAPNTTVDLSLLGLAGITLILNEQSITGDGISGKDVFVNAIHLIFNATALGLATLTGDIVISHSEAHIAAQPTPAPEPATLALMSLGFAAMSCKSRRKAAVSFG
ncbi:PEP-CTERM sorting domain-containing protein [Methylocaldum sp. MU1018]